MDYRRRAVERYFSSHYQGFVPRSDEGWEWVEKRIELNFGDALHSVPRDAPILDIGCGVGYLEAYLLQRGFSNIRAIDLSAEQIAVARQRLLQLGIPYDDRLKFEIMDVFDDTEGLNTYAAIAMLDFIEHFTKPKVLALLDLAYKELRSGGCLLIRTPNAEHPMFGRFYNDFTHETPLTRTSLMQCLNLAGFSVNRIGYETMPAGSQSTGIRARVRSLIESNTLRMLAKALNISPESLSPDLVAISQK